MVHRHITPARYRSEQTPPPPYTHLEQQHSICEDDVGDDAGTDDQGALGDGAVLEQVGVVGLKGAPRLLPGVLLGVEEW